MAKVYSEPALRERGGRGGREHAAWGRGSLVYIATTRLTSKYITALIVTVRVCTRSHGTWRSRE